MLKTINTQLNQLLTAVNSKKIDTYMGDNPEDERKYILHNKDRFKVAIKEADEIMSRMVKTNPHILDIGTSPLTFLLKKRYPKATIVTIDISERFKKRCQLFGITLKKIDLNAKNINLGSNRYDLIFFLEVLEHLNGNHKKILNSVFNSLKNGGFCILQTPNRIAPKGIILTNPLTLKVWDLFSKRLYKGEEEEHSEFIHHKEYTLPELKKTLGIHKNIITKKATYDLYFDTVESAMVYRNHTWTKILARINNLVVKIIPIFRRGMIVVVQKENKA